MTSKRFRDSRHPLEVLRVDASARNEASVSRSIGDRLLEALSRHHGDLRVRRRDLAATPPSYLDADWVEATFTTVADRHPRHLAALAESDRLVQELIDADVLIITSPLYNFGIPATLKAWIDLVARARLTFRYTEQGVEGLLKGKRAFLVMATGGVRSGEAADFATPYLRHVLHFLGIEDVQVIAADRLNRRGEQALTDALARIESLLPSPESRNALAAKSA